MPRSVRISPFAMMCPVASVVSRTRPRQVRFQPAADDPQFVAGVERDVEIERARAGRAGRSRRAGLLPHDDHVVAEPRHLRLIELHIAFVGAQQAAHHELLVRHCDAARPGRDEPAVRPTHDPQLVRLPRQARIGTVARDRTVERKAAARRGGDTAVDSDPVGRERGAQHPVAERDAVLRDLDADAARGRGAGRDRCAHRAAEFQLGVRLPAHQRRGADERFEHPQAGKIRPQSALEPRVAADRSRRRGRRRGDPRFRLCIPELHGARRTARLHDIVDKRRIQRERLQLERERCARAEDDVAAVAPDTHEPVEPRRRVDRPFAIEREIGRRSEREGRERGERRERQVVDRSGGEEPLAVPLGATDVGGAGEHAHSRLAERHAITRGFKGRRLNQRDRIAAAILERGHAAAPCVGAPAAGRAHVEIEVATARLQLDGVVADRTARLD